MRPLVSLVIPSYNGVNEILEILQAVVRPFQVLGQHHASGQLAATAVAAWAAASAVSVWSISAATDGPMVSRTSAG